MIQYPIDDALLKRLVNDHDGKWFDDVLKWESRGSSSSEWSRVKPVFEDWQYRKCCYCEKLLPESEHGGSVEQDVEHFRPKNEVNDWAFASEFGIPVRGKLVGYFAHRYNVRNYALSCKTCNSHFKRGFFPTMSDPLVSKTTWDFEDEKALLIHPLDPNDSDPTEHIEFDGYLPIPKTERGRFLIKFFELGIRDDLLTERSRHISDLYQALKSPTKSSSVRILSTASEEGHPHASCRRSFLRLYAADSKKADLRFKECRTLIESKTKRKNAKPVGT
jgi:hypothetical protein